MFQKGSKVEVMNKTELPTSWCVAEVVSGNRHTYNLRYDCYPGVEKVSREFIRPCPPRPKDFQSWMAGDIVEVFDDNSWKTATVCKVTNEGHFSVRPHGFTHERNVPKSEIRTRQSWQDGQWVPIVKISGSYGDVNAKTYQENDNDAGLQESRVVSSKTLKRASPFCSSPGNAKKLKEHTRRLIPNQSLEKHSWFHVGASIPIWIGLLVPATLWATVYLIYISHSVGHLRGYQKNNPFTDIHAGFSGIYSPSILDTDKIVCCLCHISEE